MWRGLLPLLALLVLAACSDGPKDKITGTRVAVLTPAAQLKPDETVAETTIDLPDAVENAAWPQAMGLPDGALGNMALNRKLDQKWKASIGEGASKRTKLMTRPIVAGSTAFTMDVEANVRAFALKDGEQKWSRSIAPEDADEDQFGGGLAFDGAQIYATTGYGEVVSLNAADGKINWRTDVRDVVRSAPLVYQGRVFVMTVMGQLNALNSSNGQILWTHTGISESSAILGSSTPVIAGDVIIVPYNSGELYAVRVQNGRTIWSQSLASATTRSAAPAMSDIKASPAIDGERTYAVSYSGRTAAIDIRSGNTVWDADFGGIDTPVLAGDNLFALASSNTLVTLDRASGRVHKVTELSRYEDDDSSERAVLWNGPVLAAGILWVTNNLGELAGYDAAKGDEVFRQDIAGAISLPPIVAAQTLLVLTDSGELVAYR